MTLEPCPFCGHHLDINGDDTVYPTGIYWRYRGDLGCKIYIGFNDRMEDDNPCYKVVCDTSSGGCGVTMTGDSEEEAIAKWNSRFTKK